MLAPRRGSAKERERLPWLWRGGAVTLVVAAFLARSYRLDTQSLWYDEGLSVALAGRSLVTIARNAAADIHPPLYYVALAGWTRFVGSSAFAARFLSVVAGTCLVALTCALGRRLWSPVVALGACLLAAISPYLIWYSQEARMYMLVATLGAAALWLSLDLLAAPASASRGHGSRWLALLALETASLYSHYLVGASVAAALNVTALLAIRAGNSGRQAGWCRPETRLARRTPRGWRPDTLLAPRTPRRWRLDTLLAPQTARRGHIRAAADAEPSEGALVARTAWLRRWLGVQLAAFLLFAPWLWWAWPTLAQWPATSSPFGIRYALAEALRVFSLGARRPDQAAAWTWLWAATAALGLVSPGRRGQRLGPCLALTWAILPPLGLWLAGLSRPAWEAKQLIAGALGFELLAAAGAVHLARLAGGGLGVGAPRNLAAAPAALDRALRSAVVGGVLLAALGLPRLASLLATWHDPRLQRDDYRGIAQTVAQWAGPGDAVLLNAPTQIEIFEYYDRRAHPTYPLPRSRPPDRTATELELGAIARRHRDLFAVLWATEQSDPDGIVEHWLNRQRYKVFDRWFGNVRLALWAEARQPLRPRALGAGVDFGGQLCLRRLAHSPLRVPRGEILTLDAWWQALRQPEADYVVFVQLLDASGRLAAQRDMPPGGGSERTSRWLAHAPATPSATAGDASTCGLATTAGTREAAAGGKATATAAREGTASPIATATAAREATASGTATAVAVHDAGASQEATAVTRGWHLDRIGLRLPPDLAPGRYTLILGLYHPTTRQRLAPDSAATRSPGAPDALTIGSVIVP